LEFNTDKSGTNIHPGNLGTVEGGVGRTFYKKVSGPVPIVMNLGAAYYAQFKVTGDSGSDIPPPLRGFMDRVFAVGPEFNIYIPGPRLTLLARYEPAFGARVHTQGQTIVFSVVWVAKSFVKLPPQP
jgi:Putative MetA-pathway of phenol degradation